MHQIKRAASTELTDWCRSIQHDRYIDNKSKSTSLCDGSMHVPPATTRHRCLPLAVGNATWSPPPGVPLGADCSERYATLLRCNGSTLMLTRREYSGDKSSQVQRRRWNADYWSTLARAQRRDRQGRDRLGSPSEWLGQAAGMSHNAAFLCTQGGEILAFGGLHSTYRAGRNDGIRMARATLTEQGVRWSQSAVVLTGRAGGCREERPYCRRVCEFDGKLSVVEFRGQLLLFARANLRHTGGRHVQMAARATGGGAWSGFETLQIAGVQAGRVAANVYFFAVHVVGDALLALMPAVLDDTGGVYASWSLDGKRWTRPLLLIRSEVAIGWRTAEQPVEGAMVVQRCPRGAHLRFSTFTVNLGHTGACAPADRPRLCTYEVPLDDLLRRDDVPHAIRARTRRVAGPHLSCDGTAQMHIGGARERASAPRSFLDIREEEVDYS